MPENLDYDELATRVADAVAGANTTLEVAGTLQQQAAGAPDEDPIGPLILALNYDLVSPRNIERREEHGPFAPTSSGIAISSRHRSRTSMTTL